jgi:hypothetical protein
MSDKLDIIDRLNDAEMYVDAIDDAIAEIKKLRRVARYATHKPYCMSLTKERNSNGQFSSYACSCGLKKASE